MDVTGCQKTQVLDCTSSTVLSNKCSQLTTSIQCPCHCNFHVYVVIKFVWVHSNPCRFFHCLFSSVLLLEIQLSKGEIPLTGLTKPHVCACPILGHRFPTQYVVVIFLFSGLWEVVIHFSDIGGIVDDLRLNRLVITDSDILLVLNTFSSWVYVCLFCTNLSNRSQHDSPCWLVTSSRSGLFSKSGSTIEV